MIKPVLHRIVLKLMNLEDVDETYNQAKAIPGFQIVADPQTLKRKERSLDSGTVVCFGPTVFNDYHVDNPLQIGDRVVFAHGAAKIITDPDTNQDFAVINDEDVVAILTKTVE
ncbi:MAG: hypothetical protein KGI54_14250 [Pseudomonadota bacterium]|nr:hypothetical protein [Pseudomonadota bacterium]